MLYNNIEAKKCIKHCLMQSHRAFLFGCTVWAAEAREYKVVDGEGTNTSCELCIEIHFY